MRSSLFIQVGSKSNTGMLVSDTEKVAMGVRAGRWRAEWGMM
jgi:hypothetical protein